MAQASGVKTLNLYLATKQHRRLQQMKVASGCDSWTEFFIQCAERTWGSEQGPGV